MEASLVSSGRSVSAMPLQSGVTIPSMSTQARPRVQLCVSASCVSTSSSPALRSSIWGTATSMNINVKCRTVSLLMFTQEEEHKMAGRKKMVGGIARSYMENKNPVFNFLNKVQGALPFVGLVARILNPEGGVGSDRIRLEEFCTRVERGSTRETSRAFYDFSARHGKVARPQFVLIWCWAAALGAGLLRSDDLIMGASRLRVSYDIQYEVENFEILMEEATKKRGKSGSPAPDVPIELRAEKALEAILQCCTGKLEIEEEDVPTLSVILKTVFPTANCEQIDLAIQQRLLDSSKLDSDSSEADTSSPSAYKDSTDQTQELAAVPETLVSEIL